MKVVLSALLLFIPSLCVDQNDTGARKFQEYGIGIVCEDELAYLDNYAMLLQSQPDTQGYLIVYGGRSDTGQRQVRDRLNRIKKYLTTNRKIDSRRIVKMDGGFRETFTVQLWIIPKGAEAPTVDPTVDRRDVKFAHKGGESDCSILYQ